MKFLYQFIFIGVGGLDLLFGFVQPTSWAFMFIIAGGLMIPVELLFDYLTWGNIGIKRQAKPEVEQ